jgi:hypothetical protein
MASHIVAYGSTKTTVDIPDDALRDLMAFSKAGTKKDAIVQAVQDYSSRRRMARLARFAGTFKDFISQGDLRKLREERT